MKPNLLLVVLSGPSGVGKDAVIDELRRRGRPLFIAITATTRDPREGERHAVNHFFVTEEEFTRLIENQELLEWAVVYGKRYGVPRAQVRAALLAGQDVLLRTDVQGAANVRAVEPSVLTVFLAPPSLAALEERMRSRGGLDEATIQRRMGEARREMEQANLFDYTIINADGRLDDAVTEFEAILTKEASREDRQGPNV